jgi:hypothetical protein
MTQPTITKDHVQKYIATKGIAWSKTTQQSEKYRLNAIVDYLDGSPQRLWEFLERRGYKSYARVTTWTRTAHFWSWAISQQLAEPEVLPNGDRVNPYTEFRAAHARYFKNAYQRKGAPLTFEEARARIDQDLAAHPDVRKKAMELLLTGMRYKESFTKSKPTASNEHGEVRRIVGKGGKIREVFFPAALKKYAAPDYDEGYEKFRRTLKDCVGVKPHDLRKLFLTQLVDKDMNVFDLLDVAGWNNIQTAQSYINGNKTRIRDLISRIVGQ